MKLPARQCGGLALLLAGTLAAEEAPFKVVVQAALPGASIKRSLLADIFLKKSTRWGDGSLISPVDQSTASPVRIEFSQRVLGKPVAGVQIFWMRQMSSPGGATPPPVKASDAEVIAFVESKPGAIGYVSEPAILPTTLKELELTE
jgi:ABC-type phosphate transport system substrate-binding protein